MRTGNFLKTIFITGINGLIGGILRRGLADQYAIRGLDVNNDPPAQGVITADISDYAQSLEALRVCMPVDCVVHLAADPRPDAPWESVLASNIIGTRNVFEAVRVLGVPKLVFASSLYATGDPRASDVEGSNPVAALRPISDYGLSKAFGETLARSYSDRYGIRSFCLRIGWVKPDGTQPPECFRRVWFFQSDLVAMIQHAIESDEPFAIHLGVSHTELWRTEIVVGTSHA